VKLPQQLGLKGWAITPSDVLAELKLQAAVPRVVNVSVNQVAAPAGPAPWLTLMVLGRARFVRRVGE
jgi:hypothetical protein